MIPVQWQIVEDACDDAAGGADFVLAHLSDPHLSSLDGISPRALLDKRFFGYLSWWRRRRHEHRTEVLDALRADLLAQRPNHVAITGDLTHLGLPREFREAADWLDRLGAPGDITVVPGNHDTYVAEPWQATFAHWSDYMAGDGAGQASTIDDAFPSLRIRGPVALIGLSTATPTAPLLATGRLGEHQLRRLDQILEKTAASGLFRTVLLHHPPATHTVNWRKSLVDGAQLREIVARRGAELLLHGHAHFSTAAYLDPAHSQALAIGVPSASVLSDDVAHGARYHLCSIRAGADGWQLRISVRAYASELGRFITGDGGQLRSALAQSSMRQMRVGHARRARIGPKHGTR